MRSITASFGGSVRSINMPVATLPAYLLAKIHAAHARGLEKDRYDIAYVLINNDAGGPAAAGRRVRERFGDHLVGATATALTELHANFADDTAQGSLAYVEATLSVHPELDPLVLANDACAAVALFIEALN